MKLFDKRDTNPAFDPPGPSPWYLRGKSIECSFGRFIWSDFEGDTKLAGLTFLKDPVGAPVLFLDFHCYVQPIREGRILVWYQNDRCNQDPAPNSSIHFEILELCKLVPIGDSSQAARDLRKLGQGMKHESQPIDTFEYLIPMSTGQHLLQNVPASFAPLGEVLVLAHLSRCQDKSNPAEEMARAVFSFNFAEAYVSIIPQDWFNTGAFDFGYQWITRVARDPNDGQIVGEGIRLGFFRLDKTGRKIEEWLIKDPFYGR